MVGCVSAPDPAPVSTQEALPVDENLMTELSPAAPTTDSASVPNADSTAESATDAEEALWAMLAQAKSETYVVLLRHAIAPGTGDPAIFQLNDCSTQRNLSEAGRQQAIDMGEAFRSRNIPVTQVLSSQWCRCLETAELMDLAPVEPFPALNSFFQNRPNGDAQTAQVEDYIATRDDVPGVIVMVTHQVNITGLSGIFPPSGSAVVVQLNDDGQLNVLGQLLEPSS
ncbi:MAG: Phosphohistidine phosphatase SixA [Phormidesmis priestleyi Ana]|uniref:Phosphohistidine phosphatase SixA n=1 Tax=Phormidesmis priestleyi Ana TaxID=1666911 RepID=A0A0P7Z183_9CYAN|nr:MAG: Phosphohistidine phosphatase SixA [Phormidesmis priestleyi Ana]